MAQVLVSIRLAREHLVVVAHIDAEERLALVELAAQALPRGVVVTLVAMSPRVRLPLVTLLSSCSASQEDMLESDCSSRVRVGGEAHQQVGGEAVLQSGRQRRALAAGVHSRASGAT